MNKNVRNTNKKSYDNILGEEGAAVEGLRKVYYSPKLFGVLPFKHKYT